MAPTGQLMNECISDQVAMNGYAVTPDFISPHEVMDLRSAALSLQHSGQMHRAGTGQGFGFSLNPELRGDEIHWLDHNGIVGHQNSYLYHLERLRQELNRSLALGLFEFEGHFAIYPVGARYRKHLDQFQNDNRRTLSCILYLNTVWQREDGGELRLYLNGENSGEYIDILPAGGTLVTFLSSQFWHEVLPAKRERISLTGWYKTRSEQPYI